MFVLRILDLSLRLTGVFYGLLVLTISGGILDTCTSVHGQIVPTATGINNGVTVAHTLTGNSIQPSCIYEWGDAVVEGEEPTGGIEGPSDKTHDYTNASYYEVFIVCAVSGEAVIFSDDNFYAGESISGFTVTSATSDIIMGVAAPVADNVTVGIQFGTGTDISLTVTVLSSDSQVDGLPLFSAPDIKSLDLPKEDFATSDLYAIQVNATNPISGTVTRHFVLAVEGPISGVSHSSPGQSGAGDTFYFLVDADNTINTVLTGENPVFTWWLLDGDSISDVAIEACDGQKTSNAFVINHNTTGQFQLDQVISNHVDSNSKSLTAYFYHAVDGFTAVLDKPISLNNENNVITFNLLDTAQLLMGNVVCTINLDNGLTENVTFALDTERDYESLSADLKTKQSTGRALVAGYYYPSVVCSNELPDTVGDTDTRQTFNLPLIVVNPVENISLSHNSPNISYHPMTHGLEVSLNITGDDLPLANISCVFTWDDAKSPVTEEADLTYDNPVLATIGFSLGDKNFTISWNCSNELTFQNGVLEVFVYYDCWNSGRYFDESVHDKNNPRNVYTNDPNTITGDVQVKVPFVCTKPLTSWFEVYSYNKTDDTETHVSNHSSWPDSASSTTLDKDTIQPGLYKIYLFTSFPEHEGSPTMGDFIFMYFSLPELLAKIVDIDKSDSNRRSVVKTKQVILDSWQSNDPGGNLTLVAPAVRAWTCKTSPNITRQEVDIYFFSGTFQSSTSDCAYLMIDNGDRTDLEYYSIPGIQFIVGQWYIFKLRFSSGNRESSKSVAVEVTNKTSITASILCRLGCGTTSAGDVYKIKSSNINFDLDVPESVTNIDISSLEYNWTFQIFHANNSTYKDISHIITNRTQPGSQIPKALIESKINEGNSYFQLKCQVSADKHENTIVSKEFVRNLAPYNGTCDLVTPQDVPIGSREVNASIDSVCVRCLGWKDEGPRKDRNHSLDSGGSVKYQFTQVFLDAENNTDPSKSPILLSVFTVHKDENIVTKGEIAQKCLQIVPLRNEKLGFDIYRLLFSDQPMRCFKLSPTNASRNSIARIDSKIYDELESPYAMVHSYVKVVLPISDNLQGESGAAEVNKLNSIATEIFEGYDESDNNQNTAQVAGSFASSVNSQDQVRDDPSSVNESNVIDFLKEGPPELDPLAESVQEFNTILSEKVKNLPVNDSSVMASVASTLLIMSEAPSSNVNGDGKANLATIYTSLTIVSKALDLKSDADIQVLTDIISATDKLGTMLAGELSEKTKSTSRDVLQANKEFDANYNDDKEFTDDTDTYIRQRQQAYVELQKERNKEDADRVDAQSLELLKTILTNTVDTLAKGVQMDFNTPSGGMVSVYKTQAAELREKPINASGTTVAVDLSGVGAQESVSIALSKTTSVLKMDGTNRAADANGQYKFTTDTPASIDRFTITIPLEPVVLNRVQPIIFEEDASKFSYHKVLIKSRDDMLCLVIRPTSPFITHYNVWINKPVAPGVSKIDFVAMATATEPDSYSVCIPSARRGPDIGAWWVGVEGIASGSNETDNSTTTVAPVRRRREATNETYNLYPAYDFGVVTTACMVWDDNTASWVSSTCDGKWNVDTSTLECDCPPQKQMTFSNSFYVAPNKIDFSSVFLKFSPLNQAAVMGTLAGVLIIYIITIIWARRNDRKDLLRWGITPLLDNFAEDNYFYVIRVYTGMRPNSATKSRIGIVIAGEEMDTGIRELYDGVRREFGTGSVLNFLLSTNMWLGDLDYVRMWHDNSGGGNFASWYLSKIEVQDVQRNETFTFMAEKWLSVDAEDSLECVLPVAKNENLNVFKNRFFANAKTTLADSHIWVSVVYRPMTSNFTRAQRASCALVFVMLTMISNAMFFQSDDDPNYETPAEVQVGPFRFSLQQLYISIVCALITTSATLVVIYLFKLSRSKPMKETVLFKPRPETTEKKYRIPYVADWLDREHKRSVKLEKHLVEKGYPKYEGFFLPYWCRYVAWLIVFASYVVCGFFIMLYSMEWGKQKSEEWLTTFFLTFFESVFCMDPFKVAIMALVFAILFRASSESSIVVDRQTIMRKYAGSQRGKTGGIRLPAPPLDHKRLEEERVIRMRELKMKTAFKDVLIQVFQIWILLSISFSNRDNKSYYMHKEIEESLLEPINGAKFSEIRTMEQYYDWINNTVILNAFPEDDYNGDKLHWRLRQFTEGGAKFRVGPPRLRQVRVPQDRCDIPYMGSVNCYGKYKTHSEETKDYCLGWADGPCDPEDKVYKFSADSWQFTSALDIWGLPLSGYYSTYGGGGYISKLSVNREVSHLILRELYDYSWVDRQTRAVIFEFTLYCLNVNIFTYNMFMIEFPETGGAFPFSFILPLRVYQHTGALGTYTLICEVIFLLFLVTMTIMAIVGIYKERRAYFSQPWQVYDLVFITAGYVAVAMYIARVVMTDYALQVFRDDKKEFVNFYHVAIWDQILVLLIGILVFLAIFRLLNILGYNKRIGAVARVFTNAAGDLLWFGLFFLTIFTCYAVFGYLLFGSNLSSYKNVYRTMGTLFISMIGKSRFTEIEDTDPIMSKLYFMVFIFFVVYMILTMFLAILSQSIDKVHEETKNDKGDEMVEYLMRKFRKFLGYGQGTDEEQMRHRRNLQMYSAQPAAPWNMKKGRKFEYDNRQILEDIRMSLTDAMMMNMDPKEFSTPEPDKHRPKKLRH